MRKTAAILFLFVFAFNLFGYRILISFLQTKAEQKLEAAIDKSEFSDDELIELRVDLNMPYQQRFTDFERHYGQISINGKEYSYVKRKIDGDVLILKCIPNHSKTQLKDIVSDITKSNSNSGSPNGSPVKSTAKIFSFECDDFQSPATTLIENKIKAVFYRYTDSLSEVNFTVLLQPPQAVCI